MVAVGSAVTMIGDFSALFFCCCCCSFLEFFSEKRKLERREKKLFFLFFGGASRSAATPPPLFRGIDRGNDEDEFVEDDWGMAMTEPVR